MGVGSADWRIRAYRTVGIPVCLRYTATTFRIRGISRTGASESYRFVRIRFRREGSGLRRALFVKADGSSSISIKFRCCEFQ